VITAYIGIGSNLGDRLENLKAAARLIENSEDVELKAVSSAYESAAIGPEQPDYVNAAVEIRTNLNADELLKLCTGIEDEMGRKRTDQKWAPRNIDLDILLYGDVMVDTPDLKVPHVELTNRAFVLLPLTELNPELIHPVRNIKLSEFIPLAEKLNGSAQNIGPFFNRPGNQST